LGPLTAIFLAGRPSMSAHSNCIVLAILKQSASWLRAKRTQIQPVKRAQQVLNTDSLYLSV